MRISLFAVVAGLCLGSATPKASAQAYAPDTEYHDRVQRVFVVEAARVLAWWSNPTNFSQVTYDVHTGPAQSTQWEIRWLDGARKPIKSAKVSYDTNLLNSGAEFYRSVLNQLWHDWEKLPKLQPEEVERGYWRGAARMGLSREESLAAALRIVPNGGEKPAGEWMPEIAGLLAHAALAQYGASVTLDKLLLARSAAWLAMAERGSGAKLDRLWVPLLFQAGREHAAAEIWAKAGASKAEQPGPQQAGWSLWVRKPMSREVFLFATARTNLAMAMPMLAYDTMANATGRTLGELIGPLAGTQERLEALHNYAPLLATRSSIGGGRILEGEWPMLSRLAWAKLMAAYTPSAIDYLGYTGALAEMTRSLAKPLVRDPEADPSTFALRQTAPLLRLAPAEGVGSLTPVGVVTARDLLNYGWEMTGYQMGARYEFVQYRWGVPELAQTIYKSTTTALEGLMPFFRRQTEAGIANYGEELKRLELVEGLYQLIGFTTPGTDTNKVTQAGARAFVKRCWLRPLELEWQVRALWDGEAPADIPELMQVEEAQGGCAAAAAALTYLTSLDADALRQLPKSSELKRVMAQALPQPSMLTARILYDIKRGGSDNFSRGQEYERMYWQNPDSGLESWIIHNYIFARAFKSARRFYSQARPDFQEPVGFSNGGGLDLYILGYCQNDAELRGHALEDSQSGSYMDMIMHIWEAGVRDRPKEIETLAGELVERYESNAGADSGGRHLLRFLPLLPALRDPGNGAHREALEFFAKDPGWFMLRLIWLEKYKLSTEDAVVFLGGTENSHLGRLLVAYVKKDAVGVAQELNGLVNDGNARSEQKTFGMCLYDRVKPGSPAPEDKDLKPAGAASIRRLVAQRLKAAN